MESKIHFDRVMDVIPGPLNKVERRGFVWVLSIINVTWGSLSYFTDLLNSPDKHSFF